MTLAIGHRGVAQVRPENTMASFEEALKTGVDMIETDIQRTSDGHLVILHDDRVDRTSNGHGPLRAKTLAELKALDFGGWFDPRFARERIPTLAELLDLVRGKAQLNLELKTASPLDPGVEKQLIDELRAAHMLDDCIISCFDHYALRTVRAEEPKVQTGVLYTARTGLEVDMARWAEAQALHPFFFFVTPDLVSAAHAQQIRVNAWTVDSTDVAQMLMAVGVDGIISNSPDVLKLVKGAGR